MQENIIPEGTRDLLGDECSVREELIKNVKSVFTKWGYDEVITPTVEYYNTFHYKTQSLKEEEMYKFFDSKGRILVLRPDMTVPIARVVATKLKDHKTPIRLRYESNVYRVNESLGGKRNEYTDCGVELIGLDSNSSDLEILITALEVLKVANVEEYKLEIGDINFFNSAINTLGVKEEEKIRLAELIEKKSLKALEDFLEQLDIEEDKKQFFKRLPWLFGGKSILEECKSLTFNEGMNASLKYLEDSYNKLERLGFGGFITLDLGMVPRLDYYTGIIFRGYVQGVGNTVLSGGRYDNLIKVFGRDEKAIGFSINIDCLIQLVKHESVSHENKFAITFNKDNETLAMTKALEIIENGGMVKMFPSEEVNKVIVAGKGEKNGN
ncbi:ATP phosphoribosyltransferase regulatory subunit [Clostridium gasigenes]|uniref:ATP phosphoribosyltransferase regulatory subunit n=1 Tax=Clostridium gasigenes TaxID=94869 RepID=A0A1H0S6R9_9CLOT|nr:ATP phosphoribosyltransferase regulatory subunit [Clostridium gasigenes]MBB6622751.1 ATP phosphoribosyltransferase regulatory subunit [Clostridium gasigenes]MBU3089491.1 ATP phosphoribosyltransferase regulatory subunit [Clostridium gasigenes]MBU3132938.1 ATP phosphoribosyltransferase regulatory subunit [Clostridium gasigenes]SDP37357.1 ATP phosphoribosyltransferase regulatory subunit [Clostridium gasigenes]